VESQGKLSLRKTRSYDVGFEVFTVANMKMAVIWIAAPCSLVEVYRFRDPCCLHHQGELIALMIEAARTSETLNFYQTTRRYNPEDSHLRGVTKFITPVDYIQQVGFEVLTAVSTKMAVFWVVAPCSLVEVYQRFRGPCCLHYQALMALVNFCQTTRRY
jgi:hypothetical protein